MTACLTITIVFTSRDAPGPCCSVNEDPSQQLYTQLSQQVTALMSVLGQPSLFHEHNAALTAAACSFLKRYGCVHISVVTCWCSLCDVTYFQGTVAQSHAAGATSITSLVFHVPRCDYFWPCCGREW